MGVLFSRRKRDQTTHSLLRSGVYRLNDIEDEEIEQFNGAKSAYGFWSAAKYTFILTVLLWWLPVFGQMIAGYVGGRRAGTPGRAILAALFPLIFIFCISTAFDLGYIPTEINGIIIDPNALMNGAGQNIPFVGPYLAFATMYINSWMGAIQAITLLKVDNYIITIAFAYIGGIIADQTRREMEYIAAHSGHETNIVVGREHPVDQAPVRARGLRYTKPRPTHSESSFEDMSNVGGDASFEKDEEETPIRVTKRRFTTPSSDAPMSKKEIKQKVKLMERAQKDVERKAKGKSPVDGLVNRSSKKASPKAHAPKGDGDGPGGWEYI
jgi:hypothetical protein